LTEKNEEKDLCINLKDPSKSFVTVFPTAEAAFQYNFYAECIALIIIRTST